MSSFGFKLERLSPEDEASLNRVYTEKDLEPRTIKTDSGKILSFPSNIDQSLIGKRVHHCGASKSCEARILYWVSSQHNSFCVGPGRNASRVKSRTNYYCAEHAARFAKRHKLPVLDAIEQVAETEGVR